MNDIARGLDGIVVDETAICFADKQTDHLSYRGYAIEDLTKYVAFEEVAYLLLYGALPTGPALAEYRCSLRELRPLPQPLLRVLEQLPKTADPMDVLRTGCSVLGSLEPEGGEHTLIAIGNRLIACLPSMLLYWYHFQISGRSIDVPCDEDSVAGHLLRLLHGTPPDLIMKRALEVSLIVYAEHDFNASTFAARIAASTLSDAYSAFIAAISTLRGPLHGSANASVLRFISKFRSPEDAEAELRELIARKARVPGFGQRAYSKSDPRNAINKVLAKNLSDHVNDTLLYEVSERIEQIMLRERRLFANLDYYTATIYKHCGLPIELFAPMFVIARICGLTAHIAEQRANNRLIHPSSRYVGPPSRVIAPLAERHA